MKSVVVLIDNGHGEETLGKRSPDGRLREYKWARLCAIRVTEGLKARGYDARLLTPEDRDVTINERVRRANNICKVYGSKNVCLVSIHNDAVGNGSQWFNARGLSVRIAPNASQNSKSLAQEIYMCAEKYGIQVTGNRATPKEKYWVQNLGICRDTNCPAVLTENLFMDNQTDVNFLLTERGLQTMADIHINGIINYINKIQ